MFNQNDQNKKLDWMYKGAGSSVDREDYLLGRSVDKSLEQLNAEENQKQIGALPPPKNHVEHECIPPSIRDYKLQQQLAEQVDLQAKLQEDPLLAIKKREEETRRQFLQNPVQLKKLQKALSKQEKKSKKKKRKHRDLDAKLLEKLHLLKGGEGGSKKKDRDLDIILMHKFNALKGKLSEKDLQDVMDGNDTDSDSDDEPKHQKGHSSSSDDDAPKKQNFGLVRADGSRIPLSTPKRQESKRPKPTERPKEKSPERKKRRMTEEEKEAARREMMRNASRREVERAENVRRYRDKDAKDVCKEYDADFVHKELRKSAANSSVESRIRSNRNNIQRSSGDMNSHFSRRR